jgi:hypothetical protein
MKLINNIIYRITTIDDEERKQLVLPAAHIPTVLQALHDDRSFSTISGETARLST